MLFNIKYYFCYKIACGIAKPIAIAVGMAMGFATIQTTATKPIQPKIRKYFFLQKFYEIKE